MIKIVDSTSKVTTFNHLNIGDVFKYEGSKCYIAMKIEELHEQDKFGTINAVNLVNGDMLMMYGTEIVTPIEATLTICEKKNN